LGIVHLSFDPALIQRTVSKPILQVPRKQVKG
jgi:hypothetical protein